MRIVIIRIIPPAGEEVTGVKSKSKFEIEWILRQNAALSKL
jgi:hypothetical protein